MKAPEILTRAAQHEPGAKILKKCGIDGQYIDLSSVRVPAMEQDLFA